MPSFALAGAPFLALVLAVRSAVSGGREVPAVAFPGGDGLCSHDSIHPKMVLYRVNIQSVRVT